jgi:hypothetical protein
MATVVPSTGLRSRKVDVKKHLQVFRYKDVLIEDGPLPQVVPTGVDKEEEQEHHLQAALVNKVVIPTPLLHSSNIDYDKYYPAAFHLPKSLVKFSAQLNEVIGIPYNISQQDVEFLKENQMDESLFESVIYALESISSLECPPFENCLLVLSNIDMPTKDKLLIYQHWADLKHAKGLKIMPKIKVFRSKIE